MGIDITTKAVIERMIRGVRAAEEQSVKMGSAEESGELSSLIFDIKKQIGAFVRGCNGGAESGQDDDHPIVCTFCGSSDLKFRRPCLPRTVGMYRMAQHDRSADPPGSGYWFCLTCGQEVRMRVHDVVGDLMHSMQNSERGAR